MWKTVDSDGRRVSMPFEAWRHIVEAHPELILDQLQLLRIVEAPEHRITGRETGEECFYRSGLGPSRWVKVVVHFERHRGNIVTAFPRRRFP